jgi:hypothetical protein
MGTFSNTRGAAGGYGVASSISGSPVIYAGGGGGGGHDPGGMEEFSLVVYQEESTCGPSLGGAGMVVEVNTRTAGTANTGGGGGGGGRCGGRWSCRRIRNNYCKNKSSKRC